MANPCVLRCVHCKCELELGNIQIILDSEEIPTMIKNYISTLRLVNTVIPTYAINLKFLGLLEKFIEEHGDLKNHYLRLLDPINDD